MRLAITLFYGKIYVTMGKIKMNGMIKAIRKKSRAAAASVKAAVKDFLVKVNPGP